MLFGSEGSGGDFKCTPPARLLFATKSCLSMQKAFQTSDELFFLPISFPGVCLVFHSMWFLGAFEMFSLVCVFVNEESVHTSADVCTFSVLRSTNGKQTDV